MLFRSRLAFGPLEADAVEGALAQLETQATGHLMGDGEPRTEMREHDARRRLRGEGDGSIGSHVCAVTDGGREDTERQAAMGGIVPDFLGTCSLSLLTCGDDARFFSYMQSLTHSHFHALTKIF